MILLLHGALGTVAQLAPLAARLDAAGREPVLVEFAGHGAGAPGDRPYRIERFADDALRALDRAGSAAPVDLFGYSMGGYVALWLARHAPERVARVFTLGTKTAWSADAAEREARQLDPAEIRARVPRFAATLAERHGRERWEAVLARTAEMMRALGEQPPLDEAALAAIACPVRVGVGDRDATVPVDEASRLARTLPAGELEVFPRTPHPIERVSPARLAFSLEEFLS